jgi:membrane protein
MLRFGGIGLGELVVETYRGFRDHELLTYAASLAFSATLALFPFLLFLVGVLSYFDVPWFLEALLDWVGGLLPDRALYEIATVARNAEQRYRHGLVSVGLVGATIAASGGIRAAMNALSRPYRVVRKRPVGWRLLLSMVYTLAFVLLVFAAFTLLFLGPAVIAEAARESGHGDGFVRLWRWLRYPVAALLFFILTAAAYKTLPPLDRFRLVTPGSVLAIVLWITAAFGFQYLTERFEGESATYGSIGSVIVLLVYLWVWAVIFLLGAEVNAVLRRPAKA